MNKQKGTYTSATEMASAIAVARGLQPADLVLKGVRYLDVFRGGFITGDVAILGDKIVGVADSYVGKIEVDGKDQYLVPGFIDAHVHIESSLLSPLRFQQAVMPHGTTTVIWDPHEIANVAGTAGIDWALRESKKLDLDAFVMVPSCVPSTSPALGLETSGAVLGAIELAGYRSDPKVLGLAEFMNVPGILAGAESELAKLQIFRGQIRDGHCPGFSGRDLNACAAAGIHTCHETTTQAEAEDKLSRGIHVLIREGSCAKDAAALLPILNPYSSAVVGFATDDRNPLDISIEGHVSAIIDQGLRQGLAPEVVFRAASWSPAQIYGLHDRGAVAPGMLADLVLLQPRQKDNWQSGIAIKRVMKAGQWVDSAKLRAAAELAEPAPVLGEFKLDAVQAEDFQIPTVRLGTSAVRVIGLIPHQIKTTKQRAVVAVEHGFLLPAVSDDLLCIAVCERHQGSGRRGLGIVQGFGLKAGAIASSVNHDCHNVIVVGATPAAMAIAVNELRRLRGGIVVSDGAGALLSLPLPIGGLMTDQEPEAVAARLRELKELTYKLGCRLEEPFLQLSFLALPVIPALKITDRGLVDGDTFKVVPLECT